jgi:hypothetical protein
MSTQKREHRGQRKNCPERAQARVTPRPIHCVRLLWASARGGTVSLLSLFGVVWARFNSSGKVLSLDARQRTITRFLQSDRLIRQLAEPGFTALRSNAPPGEAVRPAAFSTPASPRSSLPPIPFPSGPEYFHHSLPQAPAGKRRRAERCDGKRDMYFIHAA